MATALRKPAVCPRCGPEPATISHLRGELRRLRIRVRALERALADRATAESLLLGQLMTERLGALAARLEALEAATAELGAMRAALLELAHDVPPGLGERRQSHVHC